MATGTVREWHHEEGWGVLDSEATPGGCWAHFSVVEDAGPRTLQVGDEVTFTWETVEQDGYTCAATAIWPGAAPAYASTLSLDIAGVGVVVVPGRGPADGEALVAAARARAAALVSGDADNLRAVLHPAFTWTSHRGQVLDRETYVSGNTDGGLVWLEQRLEDVRTTVVGDTGILVATAHDRVRRDGRELTFTMPVTQTWVRTDDGWQCLAGHAGPAQD